MEPGGNSSDADEVFDGYPEGPEMQNGQIGIAGRQAADHFDKLSDRRDEINYGINQKGYDYFIV
jgi:hypothetical protein